MAGLGLYGFAAGLALGRAQTAAEKQDPSRWLAVTMGEASVLEGVYLVCPTCRPLVDPERHAAAVPDPPAGLTWKCFLCGRTHAVG